MAQDRRDAQAPDAEAVAAGAIAEYLTRHPSFLNDRPELLVALDAPSRHCGDRVVDLQHVMIDRLRAEVAGLKAREATLLAIGAANQTSQGRVQKAALALLRAQSFEALITLVTDEFPKLLNLAAVGLCVESSISGAPRKPVQGVVLMAPGGVARLIGDGRDIVMRSDIAGDRALFGSAAEAVRSMVLIRLSFGRKTPAGLLALGAAEPDGFHAELGTHLVAFLSKVLEHCIRRWLG